MPRKKAIEPEILPASNRIKIVNARHKIEYDAPTAVPDDTAVEEGDLTAEDSPIEDAERKRRRKTARDEREEIRREMEALGVVSAGDLKLMIEKYRHSESAESGTLADKVYCTKYECTREHITSQDYLNTAAKWGAGRYWFTLRHKNKIVKPWEKEITAPLGGNGAMVQRDPNDPTINIHMPENGHSAAIPADPFKEAERALSLVKKYNEAFGGAQAAQNGPTRTDDEVLASAILKQPDVIETVIGGVMKQYGRNGSGADDPSPWAVAMKLVETGQAAQIVKSLVDSFFNGVNSMIPRGQQDGQTPMGQAQVQTPYMGSPQHSQQPHNEIQGASTQAITQSAPSTSEAGPNGHGSVQEAPQQLTPADQALSMLLNDCARKIPPKVTAGNLMSFADEVNAQAPAYTIDGWIDFFASTATDEVIEVVKTLPGGAEVASLPHAREWTEQLQKLIRENQEGGDPE